MKERNARASDPLPRLRQIARQLVRRYPHGLPFGLSESDLVAEGWLAMRVFEARGRVASYPWAKARFAMMDAIRSARTGGLTGQVCGLRGMTALEMIHPVDMEPSWNVGTTPVRQQRLSRAAIRDLRAAMWRTLSPRDARLCEMLLIDGLDLADAVERCGIATIQQARVARSRAFRKLETLARGERI